MKNPISALAISITVVFVLYYLVAGITNNDPIEKSSDKAEAVRAYNEPQKIIDNTYIIKYAGEYIIKIEGVNSGDIERYILKPNGECIWRWETGRYPDVKYGSWTASKGIINTVNKGRTGDIPETFTFSKGQFRSEFGNDRILIKQKDL